MQQINVARILGEMRDNAVKPDRSGRKRENGIGSQGWQIRKVQVTVPVCLGNNPRRTYRDENGVYA
ncbi:hypothetical protein [Methylomonas sp. DH-1]|uniref:hypothetical protein n=1 Tax=Methylomonas sp. (strain DH-1) TaxID=1727196 RepID=UPI0007C8F9D2|nr:hypothetical protein [Methylomonas sp. DH-1]ANE56506.1 hypothetical protein AYM39_15865 [Methylomonas sp. DH-1]